MIFLTSSTLESCRKSAADAGERGLTKVILQADWYPQPEHGGFYTALVKATTRTKVWM